ncbi:hypothetical protein CGRA01v4_04343 [Colletotrichum graminicola]|uniref:Zn(2)-C6 fungal-type domain-containing protein n=1 Tax=Colletotrichum graminicola (strain M1.001 / M2 / FGSC 10212) TaxID=645133 RepID=E3Q9A6_COLGM|nr:uncharacterized protein GLRG_01780 [Colletotrichum graminicola M1.001]EFQ27285.1 hypothetical protein GLRG_01780 [Colletotrichum graminicola M1.001]WDK13062.1 hypothetical protein CGRA01v4_04343 [Colletotrichum graminicola]
MLFSQRSACDRCRALKSRCSRENGAKKCERCQRLQIDCFYSPPRRMGRPAKKRLSQEVTTQSTPPVQYRRLSTMSNTTLQTAQSEGFSPSVTEAEDFQYGLGIMPSPSAGGGGHEWTDNFEDPLLGFLQEHNTKLMATNWMNTGSLGFLGHHENALAAGPHDLPLTPTTVGSLPNNTDDSWTSGSDQGPAICHAESYTGATLPPSPDINVGSSEPAIKRLLDLQSLLIARRIATSQEQEDLSTLINTTVHATETLIDVVESLPPLRPSPEATQPASPVSCWGQALDAGPFNTSAPTHAAPELHDPHQQQGQRQQYPDLALTISLFTTDHLLLLDSYDNLLVALRARLQCPRQSRPPSPGGDFNLPQHFFNNASGGPLNKFSLVSSFDLDINSVVFLLSRMMKRLQKSMQDRFTYGPVASTSDAQLKGRGFPFSNASLNFNFQDGVSHNLDVASELSPTGGHPPIANMGDYASWEASKRHQNVTESLRVIRWLADEL